MCKTFIGRKACEGKEGENIEVGEASDHSVLSHPVEEREGGGERVEQVQCCNSVF